MATLTATTSQPRSLLSIAKLNRARSRMRRSSSKRVLIDQTCFGCSGGLAPISLPLFQGVRLLTGEQFSLSDMIVLLVWGFFCQELSAERPIFLPSLVFLFDLKARFFIPTRHSGKPSRAGAVQAGRL